MALKPDFLGSTVAVMSIKVFNSGDRADRQLHMKFPGNTIPNHNYLLLCIFVCLFVLMVSASNHQPLKNVVLPLCHSLLATGGTKYFHNFLFVCFVALLNILKVRNESREVKNKTIHIVNKQPIVHTSASVKNKELMLDEVASLPNVN